ncbi:MerR-like DNA binding protein [Mariniflexile fucanivorans]|uniref:MerR-like DNA binding protein n=1 Tax=Mariniflexile fucanivorans TaxID=264023 RepID=A0A4R1RHP9_9FLAO|nr:chaperone modulator CbpM [Mariniflexile fucanivorans]TCL65584.1 MerR-like DNA binding protein [Mariniflexile fucanivorans]
METQKLIPIQLICNRYNVPVSFINTLQEFQLVEIIVENEDYYIHTKQIKEVEKMIRLHYDLEINLEGVDAIYNLLKQVKSLKQEITMLHNRLRLYEDL